MVPYTVNLPFDSCFFSRSSRKPNPQNKEHVWRAACCSVTWYRAELTLMVQYIAWLQQINVRALHCSYDSLRGTANEKRRYYPSHLPVLQS